MSFEVMIARIKDILQNSILRRSLFLVLGAILYAAVVLPIVLLQPQQKGKITQEDFDTAKVELNKANGMFFRNYIRQVDPVERKVYLYAHTYAFGQLADEMGVLNKNLTCSFYHAQPKLVEKQLPEITEYTAPLLKGDIKSYPFEEFVSYIPFSCDSDDIELIYTDFDPSATGYTLTPEVKKYEELIPDDKAEVHGKIKNEQTLVAVLHFSQPATNKFFSIFITIVMWFLVISLVICSYKIIFLRQDSPPPLIALGITMLFALPKLRDAQPGAPKFDALSDIAGYYWCLVLASASISLNFFAFGLRWRKSKIGV